MNVPRRFYDQSGVVAFRVADAKLEVLLITSRNGSRWIIPKGVAEPDMTPWDSAAKEALEEAGIIGSVEAESIGSYSYPKWGGICQVDVYPMAVTEELQAWDEDFRQREWLAPSDAAQRLNEPELREILLRFAASRSVAD